MQQLDKRHTHIGRMYIDLMYRRRMYTSPKHEHHEIFPNGLAAMQKKK